MTYKFYFDLLEYIDEKQKMLLFSILQKKRIRINGFRMNKDLPSSVIAAHIAKNGKSFFKILLESYTPSYVDKESAVQAFSSDTALLCLAYFVNNKDPDEGLFTSLMKKNPVEPIESPSINGGQKAQKKSDEFRQKYLSDHKELLRVKQELESTLQHVNDLQNVLKEKKEELGVLQDKLQSTQSDHETVCKALNSRIKELEEAIYSHKERMNSMENKLLVLLESEEENGFGVAALPWGRIGELITLADDYSEILFVGNDIPFHVKRQIRKISHISGKLHSFPTKAELIGYIEKGRHK